MSVFSYDKNGFLLDGTPFRIISGSIHYFRSCPQRWSDLLRKLKVCGFNTVETYIPWNLHEPHEGDFRFDGLVNLEQFLRLAGAEGLKVILRPAPYICAEWDFGGLPAWLLKDRSMTLRCADPKYLQKVSAYYNVLIPKLVPFQCTNGGPLIACQIENEYGSYGNDKEYLRFLEQTMRSLGLEILLFTSDGPTDMMLTGGTLPDVLKTANFGSRPAEAFQKLREYQTDGPLMCAEYWNGWFDHWGEEHHVRDPRDAVETFREMLDAGASVNFYMFHGGTNFGFMNGANYSDKYEPTITSYDYCAPLTEEGNTTPKYDLLRELLKNYSDTACNLPIREKAPTCGYGKVVLTQKAHLMPQRDRLASVIRSAAPLPMEQYDQSYGAILYRTKVGRYAAPEKLEICGLHDRAHIFVNGRKVGILYRANHESVIEISLPLEENVIDILVENMGRVNYGPRLHDRKGIDGGVRLHYQHLFGWDVWPMEMEDLSRLEFSPAGSQEDGPVFLKGTFTVDQCADTYLRTDSLNHGSVWINGFNLGRYWPKIGPQKTLYLPAPLLKEGENELLILEYDGASNTSVEFVDCPDLG